MVIDIIVPVYENLDESGMICDETVIVNVRLMQINYLLPSNDPRVSIIGTNGEQLLVPLSMAELSEIMDKNHRIRKFGETYGPPEYFDNFYSMN